MTADSKAVAAARPRPRAAFARRTVQVILHLTAREFRIRYRSAVLGWLWAVIPAVARFAVLGAIFSLLLPYQGPDYLAELAIGILGWNWFASGVESATASAVDRRDLLAQPALPRQVVPVVSVLTDAFDYLAGLPVLLLIVLLDVGSLPATAPVFAYLLLLQGCLILGIGMAASVADVRWRDTRRAVALILSVGIYVTPVFYTGRALSEGLRTLVSWNPMGAMLEAQRDVLVRGTVPSLTVLLALTVVCSGALAIGWLLHRRYAATFLDYL
jgi:lipopolysaccharide transport system permease protein